jgi:NTE family protein
VVTTELVSGRAQLISAGDAVEALLASAALPGVFPPVTVDGRQLVDGGVAANTPVREAEILGATHIYVLPAALGPANEASSPALRIALGALNSLLHGDRDALGSQALVQVAPSPVSPTGNFLDFRHTVQLIVESYHLTQDWLNHLEPVVSAAA